MARLAVAGYFRFDEGPDRARLLGVLFLRVAVCLVRGGCRCDDFALPFAGPVAVEAAGFAFVTISTIRCAAAFPSSRTFAAAFPTRAFSLLMASLAMAFTAASAFFPAFGIFTARDSFLVEERFRFGAAKAPTKPPTTAPTAAPIVERRFLLPEARRRRFDAGPDDAPDEDERVEAMAWKGWSDWSITMVAWTREKFPGLKNRQGEKFYLEPSTGDMVFVKETARKANR